MGQSKKRKNKSKNKARQKGSYSGFSVHRKHGTKLITPMSSLNMVPLEWERDLLPEHLWIASLAATYPQGIWESLYNQFMDAIDPFIIFPNKAVSLGFISDFGMVPESKRDEVKTTHRDLIYKAFHKPFGRLLAFYPESPAYWLVQQDEIEKEGPLEPEVELRRLSELIVKLFPGKDLFVGHLRAAPLNRLFKHNKIFLFKELPVIELIPRYPGGCTDEERYHVQQFARSTLNTQYMSSEIYKEKQWPKYFWCHNYDLVPCYAHKIANPTGRRVELKDTEPLIATISGNASMTVDYLNTLSLRVRCDLYTPERDEILLGLFARITRRSILYVPIQTFGLVIFLVLCSAVLPTQL